MSDEIVCERRGAAGLQRLEGPRALDALTPGMVLPLRKALDQAPGWHPASQAKVGAEAAASSFALRGSQELEVP
jgi:hypothetical protein